MCQSDDSIDRPQSDYEKWMALGPGSGRFNPKGIEPHAFAGWRRPVRVFGFEAFDMCSNAPRIERTHQDVRFDGMEHYCAVFQSFGASVIIQNDQSVQLAAGDVGLFDSGQPVTCVPNYGSAQWLCVHLPRQMLVFQLGFEPTGGVCGRRGTLASRLLFDAVRDAASDNRSPSSQSDSYMQSTVYDLLGAVFGPSDKRLVPRHAARLFARICGVINDRCADPDFGPREAAAETGISLRYLQKLFTKRGQTCSQYIYSLRLDHAVRLLHRRTSLGTRQPLSEIAYACGFHDYTHFARKFRQRFGYTPGAHSGAHDGTGQEALRPSTSSNASQALRNDPTVGS